VPRSSVKLIIAVPLKHTFKDFVNVAIDIFRAALDKLQSPPSYELCAFEGTYDELVGNVSERVSLIYLYVLALYCKYISFY